MSEKQPGDDELIDASAFISTKLSFIVSNVTTRTVVKKDANVQLVQFFDRGMQIEVPQRTCAKGHSLMLKITATKPDKSEVVFECTGKVDEVEPKDEEKTENVSLTLVQFEEKRWEAFLKLFSSRQEEILAFFAAAKG